MSASAESKQPRVKVLLEEALALLGCDVGSYNVQLRVHDGHLVKLYVTREIGASALAQFDPEPERPE